MGECVFGAYAFCIVKSEDPYQTAYSCSLIRDFAVRLLIYWMLYNISMDCKTHDQMSRRCWLIWVFLLDIFLESHRFSCCCSFVILCKYVKFMDFSFCYEIILISIKTMLCICSRTCIQLNYISIFIMKSIPSRHTETKKKRRLAIFLTYQTLQDVADHTVRFCDVSFPT